MIAGTLILYHVRSVLLEYEARQPETTLSSERISIVRKLMEFDVKANKYNGQVKEIVEYRKKLKNANEIEFAIKTGGYSETGAGYDILADGELVGTVTLESTNPERKLLILTLSTWEVKEVVPVIQLTSYNYTALLPEDFQITVNGYILNDGKKDEETGYLCYELKNFYTEPKIVVCNELGEEEDYSITDNVITCGEYAYSLNLPANYSVSVKGKEIEGVAKEDGLFFEFKSPYKTALISDGFGNTITYKYGDGITLWDYVVSVPSNYTCTSEAFNTEDYITGDDKKLWEYEVISAFSEVPHLRTYTFNKLLAEPKIEVKNNLGKEVEVTYNNGLFEVTAQAGLESVPEEILAQVDPLEIAELWAAVLIRDEDFKKIAAYLVKDSVLYQTAYYYTHSVDVSFISNHETKDIYNESVTNFIAYSDNCFSCDITFTQELYLVRTKEYRYNTTYKRFFYAYLENENRWILADAVNLGQDE
ncbi:MAG: hypothetical protein K6B75_03120 [Lachnospiraceae bacterium]|nr:hypothetical protein [Lachnospiraceae bacterium]